MEMRRERWFVASPVLRAPASAERSANANGPGHHRTLGQRPVGKSSDFRKRPVTTEPFPAPTDMTNIALWVYFPLSLADPLWPFLCDD